MPGRHPRRPGITRCERKDTTVQDWLDKMMPDPEKWAEQFAAHPVVSRPIVMPMGEPLAPFSQAVQVDDEPIIVKAASYIEVPDELLMDLGVIPDTRPPRPPAPWRHRLRNRVSDWRERAARRAYKVIAGYWPDGGEDW
jgi:hypothetical protein